MNAIVGWMLVAAAIAAGYVGWGWPGVALALTVVVFWLLLQFSRAMRVLKVAGQRPKGLIDSAVMFNSRLSTGLQMMEVVKLTKSLGTPVDVASAAVTETWRWHDAGGDAVEVQLRNGRVSSWQLQRAEATRPDDGPAAPPP